MSMKLLIANSPLYPLIVDGFLAGKCLMSPGVESVRVEKQTVLVVDISPDSGHAGAVTTRGLVSPHSGITRDRLHVGSSHQGISVAGYQGGEGEVGAKLDHVAAYILESTVIGFQDLLVTNDWPQTILTTGVVPTSVADLLLHLLSARTLLDHLSVGVNAAPEPKCLISTIYIFTGSPQMNSPGHQMSHDLLVNALHQALAPLLLQDVLSSLPQLGKSVTISHALILHLISSLTMCMMIENDLLQTGTQLRQYRVHLRIGATAK